MPSGIRFAAVDLGSNSYRLEIARVEHGHLQRAEYLKETVRQGSGLDANRHLTREAMQRGWDCLARFAERLSGFERGHVRAVATQTLREARNRDEFLERACEVLGFPIDVISGHEEARLIYSGVAHLLPQSAERRLVIDIGGRSTEMILGRGRKPLKAESFQIGSVSLSMRFFPTGAFTAEAFRAAQIAAVDLNMGGGVKLTNLAPEAHLEIAAVKSLYGSDAALSATQCVPDVVQFAAKRGDNAKACHHYSTA